MGEDVPPATVRDAWQTWWRAGSSPPTYVVMLGAVLGAAIGAAVLLADWSSWTDEQQEQVNSGSFTLWASLICIQTALWALATPPVIATMRRHRSGWSRNRAEIVLSSVLLVAIVVGVVVSAAHQKQIPEVIPHSRLKIRVLTGVALLLALLSSIAIWLIRGRLKELRAGSRTKQLQLYMEFRSDLERLLGVLGAVVGLAVLATAALRQAVLAQGKPESVFPAESPLLYGLVLSATLALVYVPTYLALREAGSDLRDRAAPLLEPTDPGFEAAVAKRTTLAGLLSLEVSASSSLRGGLAILSPLLASLVSLLPKLGG